MITPNWNTLPKETIREFDEKGCLIVRRALDQKTVAHLLEVCDQLIGSNEKNKPTNAREWILRWLSQLHRLKRCPSTTPHTPQNLPHGRAIPRRLSSPHHLTPDLQTPGPTRHACFCASTKLASRLRPPQQRPPACSPPRHAQMRLLPLRPLRTQCRCHTRRTRK